MERNLRDANDACKDMAYCGVDVPLVGRVSYCSAVGMQLGHGAFERAQAQSATKKAGSSRVLQGFEGLSSSPHLRARRMIDADADDLNIRKLRQE